jgi:hydroxyacyl-ACP dehydratase HTD2-like protein with hotdog domain
MMPSSRLQGMKAGELLPEREFKPDNIQLFFYNAALWNAHRIHFDYPYATEVEGYPGLVIAGPLLGDWLNQCVTDWVADDGLLASIEYSNRKASYIGETLRSGGKVLSIDLETGEVELEVTIKNEADEVIAPGTAIARFDQGLTA